MDDHKNCLLIWKSKLESGHILMIITEHAVILDNDIIIKRSNESKITFEGIEFDINSNKQIRL